MDRKGYVSGSTLLVDTVCVREDCGHLQGTTVPTAAPTFDPNHGSTAPTLMTLVVPRRGTEPGPNANDRKSGVKKHTILVEWAVESLFRGRSKAR